MIEVRSTHVEVGWLFEWQSLYVAEYRNIITVCGKRSVIEKLRNSSPRVNVSFEVKFHF